jgi:hypothetical protein
MLWGLFIGMAVGLGVAVVIDAAIACAKMIGIRGQ